MGMVLGMVTADDATIERLVQDPPLVWKVLSPDDPEMYERARGERDKRPFFARLFGRKPQEGGAPPADLPDDPKRAETDLDKAWHAIHYLLTGTDWEGDPPLNFLAAGGRQIRDIDVGYGPPHVLTSSEVRAARDALRALSDDTLRSRFKPAEMMELQIYPEIWDRDPNEDDTLGYCMEYVKTLREFLDKAVDDRRGIVVYLS